MDLVADLLFGPSPLTFPMWGHALWFAGFAWCLVALAFSRPCGLRVASFEILSPA